MPKLPVISGRDFIKVLNKLGFQEKRQKGSHIILIREKDQLSISVPNHKELDRGTMNSLMKSVGLSREELIKLLR
ncbi:MAG: type II toxin-antitoxin system HicA family toxin [Thermoplasmataceae archaeon]